MTTKPLLLGSCESTVQSCTVVYIQIQLYQKYHFLAIEVDAWAENSPYSKACWLVCEIWKYGVLCASNSSQLQRIPMYVTGQTHFERTSKWTNYRVCVEFWHDFSEEWHLGKKWPFEISTTNCQIDRAVVNKYQVVCLLSCYIRGPWGWEFVPT